MVFDFLNVNFDIVVIYLILYLFNAVLIDHFMRLSNIFEQLGSLYACVPRK